MSNDCHMVTIKKHYEEIRVRILETSGGLQIHPTSLKRLTKPSQES